MLNLYSSISSISYQADISDSNSSISCYAQQSDQYGNILYQAQESILLLVDPAPPEPLPLSLSARLGMVSGVLITIIFLLLVCVTVTAVMCRNQKQARTVSCDSSDYSKPVWVTINSARPHYTSNSSDISEEAGDIPTYTSDQTHRHNTHRHKCSENQKNLNTRIPDVNTVSPVYETHFDNTQGEAPTTLPYPRGLFIHPPVKTRSISCIEPYQTRKVSTSPSEGFPCCSQSRYSLWLLS